MGRTNPFKLKQTAVRLVSEPPLYSSEVINTPEAAVKLLSEELKTYDREVVAVVNLKTDLEPINFSIVSMGVLDSSLIHPRELMKNAFLSNARGIIMVHNHPSGNLEPSKCDIEITDRMLKICNLIGVDLMDHVIIGAGNDKSFYSMKEKKELNFNMNIYTHDINKLKWPEAKAAEEGKDYSGEKPSVLCSLENKQEETKKAPGIKKSKAASKGKEI